MKRKRKAHEPRRPEPRKPAAARPADRGSDRLDRLRDCIAETVAQAAALLPPNRLAELTARFGGDLRAEAARLEDFAEALVYAIDLAVFTAPPGRSTAIERLARQVRPRPGSDEALVLQALGRARFTLFAVEGPHAPAGLAARDLLSGARLVLLDAPPAAAGVAGKRFAARLAPIGEGHLPAGPVVPLDDAGLEAARPWLSRDGRSLANPARCAEALYHHAIRCGVERSPGINAPSSAGPEAAAGFPFRPDESDLHVLAFRWSALPEGEEPPAEEIRHARTLIAEPFLMDGLSGVAIARDRGLTRLAASYERLMVLLLDTLDRRTAIGNRRAAELLAWFEQEIGRAIAAREIPPELRPLYAELRRKAGAAAGSAAGTGAGTAAANGPPAAELDKLRARLQALRAKTVEQGCTEEEALAAARKVAELLDRYGLSLSELELRRQHCEGFGIATGRRRRGPIDAILPSIAAFCDCRYWGEKAADGEIRYVFFGLPADVEGAHYLYDLITVTLEQETAAFKRSALYDEHPTDQRAGATRSFQAGMIDSIARRLDALKRDRDAGIRSAHGRDLVPLKAGVIDEELEKLGLSFRTVASKSQRLVLAEAYQRGREAGEAFTYRPGLPTDPSG